MEVHSDSSNANISIQISESLTEKPNTVKSDDYSKKEEVEFHQIRTGSIDLISPLNVDSYNFTIDGNTSNKIELSESETIGDNSLSLEKKNTFFSLIDYYDKKYSEYIFNLEVSCPLETIIFLSARLYNPECQVCYFLLILAYYSYFYKQYFFFVKPLIHVLMSLILSTILKCSIGRKRPEIKKGIKRRHNLRKRESNHSMPSGDALQAGNFAIILMCYFNNCILGIVIIPMVCLGRMFYFCHYIMDTVVGAIIGFVFSIGVYHTIKLVERKFNIHI